jgi:arylsulfatase A-like enzyme
MSGKTENKDRAGMSSDTAGNASDGSINRRNILLGTSSLVAAATLTSSALAQAQKATPAAAPAAASGRPPNILLIMADDIGWFDVGAYNRGIMGGPTPNIDRIAAEGALHTDHYGQASCTAGRAAFITGQIPMRTGLTTVGMPGAKQGLQAEDPTIADLLKPLGYMACQTGKNHLGDRNEYLPTVHGFDEFYGNLYHLNAEEEPEQDDYPKGNEKFKELFGPRGVLETKATDRDDPTEDKRFGRVGKQTIKDTGPLDRKRMTTVEDDLLARSVDFMDRANKSGKPFLLWHNTTRMHVWTHLSERWAGKTGLGLYSDGMEELDWVVGQLLKKVDDLGIASNTLVIFTTDNGAEKFTWPDGGTTPFRGEKGLGWEGGFRVPFLIRWPGKIRPGQVINGITSHEDVLPTVLPPPAFPTSSRSARRDGRRKELQGSPRWLQSAALSHRSGEGLAARGILLLWRGQPPSRPCAAAMPSSPKCARIALINWVRWRISRSRVRCCINWPCCSADLIRTKRMVGRRTASQIASASAASFLLRLTHAFTSFAGIRRTSWPSFVNSRTQ